jgi:hypothetical protein
MRGQHRKPVLRSIADPASDGLSDKDLFLHNVPLNLWLNMHFGELRQQECKQRPQ